MLVLSLEGCIQCTRLAQIAIFREELLKIFLIANKRVLTMCFGKKGVVTCKMELQKAYYNYNLWTFLGNILSKLSFPQVIE